MYVIRAWTSIAGPTPTFVICGHPIWAPKARIVTSTRGSTALARAFLISTTVRWVCRA